jgi:hypothetical protein
MIQDGYQTCTVFKDEFLAISAGPDRTHNIASSASASWSFSASSLEPFIAAAIS